MELQPERKAEISLKEFLLLVIKWVKYIFSRWKILLLAMILGALIGFFYCYTVKPKYNAITTFVLDEQDNKGAGLGLANLNLGGNKKSSDLFHGDNLKWLYSTRAMLQRTLLTPVLHHGKRDLLITRFLRDDPEARKLLERNPTLSAVRFSEADADSVNNPLKNRVINLCISLLSKGLRVNEVDKTNGVIKVSVLSSKEDLAMDLAQVLVATVNDYYVKTKTQKAQEQVNALQLKASEYSDRLSSTMYQTASSIDNVPYANPNRQVSEVPARRRGIDVEVNTTLYGQIMASLELAKADLAKATPILLVVDAPTYPLPVEHPSTTLWSIVGAIVALFLTISFLLIRKILTGIMAQP